MGNVKRDKGQSEYQGIGMGNIVETSRGRYPEMGMGNNREMSEGAGNENGSIREGSERVSIRKMEEELSGRQVEVWTPGLLLEISGDVKEGVDIMVWEWKILGWIMGSVPYRHGGGWSKKINAWYLNTLMVYL